MSIKNIYGCLERDLSRPTIKYVSSERDIKPIKYYLDEFFRWKVFVGKLLIIKFFFFVLAKNYIR